jgi:TRAP-type C4-dicarboxylate transport system permease small subunit
MRIILFKIRNFIRKANFILVVTLMASMMTVVVVQTLSRYLFKLPLFWAEELARYLMIWLCFTASAIAMREDAHVSVMFLISRLNGGLQKWSKVLVKLLLVIFLSFLVIKGISLLSIVSRQMSPTMRISMAWPYLAIPFGSALMMFEIGMSFFKEESSAVYSQEEES